MLKQLGGMGNIMEMVKGLQDGGGLPGMPGGGGGGGMPDMA